MNWYTGRGIFLDPPTVFMQNGVWKLTIPEVMDSGKVEEKDRFFSLRDELFFKSRDSSDLAGRYSTFISQQLLLASEPSGFTKIGALIIEPGKFII
ncbi:unnamed protein product [Thlaspi arvense]|uniref:Uncharacterized protein n=1 Tax=Thlaspi arvense TaxID=13288 RepID=A0AAU9RKT1_THLAR|nr:unnamed protein product [Thlaspi arvense]